jgi:hypothetical protein
VLDGIAAALSKIGLGIPTWSPSAAALPSIETILDDAELQIELNRTAIAQLTRQTESLDLRRREVMNMLEGVEELLGNWRTIVPGTTKYDCSEFRKRLVTSSRLDLHSSLYLQLSNRFHVTSQSSRFLPGHLGQN